MVYKEKEHTAHHSTAYHKYYEGYSERRILKKNGKGYKIERVYVGVYYVQQLTLNQRILLKIFYCLAVFLSIYVFIYAAAQDVPSNYVFYVTFFEAVMVVCLAFICIATGNWIVSGSKMKIREYKSASRNLKRYTLAGCICALVMSLSTIASMIVGRQYTSDEISCILCFLLVAGLLLAVRCVECNITYVISENNLEKPTGSYDIN